MNQEQQQPLSGRWQLLGPSVFKLERDDFQRILHGLYGSTIHDRARFLRHLKSFAMLPTRWLVVQMAHFMSVAVFQVGCQGPFVTAVAYGFGVSEPLPVPSSLALHGPMHLNACSMLMSAEDILS